MEIINMSRELTKKEIYFLTKAQNIQKMSDQDEQILELDYWCMYEDTNSDGKLQTIFSCRTKDGDMIATNSDTFIGSINDMLEVFDKDEIQTIQVKSGKSKNNRTFYYAVYVEA